MAIIVALPRGSRRQSTPESHRGSPEGLLRTREHSAGGTVWVQTPTLDGCHDVRSTTTAGTGVEGHPLV